ncbi:MAG: MotA/TolQ/ExbB proton channel family protein [Planctomycetota bacterium]|nr:MAG: MotA/TolQ/ExbB proton channel family protein [Planctomycetota bacterium]
MLYDLIQNSGWWLMAPILVALVVVITIVIDRTLFWLKEAYRRDLRVRQLLIEGKISPKEASKSSDLVVRALCGYLECNLELAKLIGKQGLQDSRRYLPTLALVGTLSTSLGLLGTVVGVSISFSSMEVGDAAGKLQGLSTALYTTIAGLVVYLIASVAGHIFSTFSNTLAHSLEEHITALQSRLEREEHQNLQNLQRQQTQAMLEKLSSLEETFRQTLARLEQMANRLPPPPSGKSEPTSPFPLRSQPNAPKMTKEKRQLGTALKKASMLEELL